MKHLTGLVPASHPQRHARGLTLIEILIALAIGSLLILGLVQVFAASRAAYQLSEGLARTQENARFAMDYLQRDIRMAGHFGCVNDQAHWVKEEGDPAVHFGSPAAFPLNFSVAIQGYEATGTAPDNDVTVGAPAPGWSPALPGVIATLVPAPAAGSDIIVLRYFADEGVPVATIAGAPPAEVITSLGGSGDVLTSNGNPAPTMFGVADCTHASVFPGTGVFPTGPTGVATVSVSGTASPSPSLGDRYTPQPSGQTRIYRAESVVFYVAENGSGEPALFRAKYVGGAYVPEELVEGIESLQFLYGRDSVPVLTLLTPPTGNITFQNVATPLGNGSDAASANEWRRVGLVQVGMLARSTAPAAAAQTAGADQHRRVLGVTFEPPAVNDTRYRASYEATVALRNRLFGN